MPQPDVEPIDDVVAIVDRRHVIDEGIVDRGNKLIAGNEFVIYFDSNLHYLA